MPYTRGMADAVVVTKATVQIEEELWRRFRVVAMREGKSASEIVRGFIAAYVEAREQ